MKTLMALFLLVLLCACGGGEDDSRQEVGPPDCKARPELCR